MIFRAALPADEASLADLFCSLTRAGEETLFHPHPLTPAAARAACCHHEVTDGARDEYHVALDAQATHGGPDVVGYGLLRGWVEGYAIPSLGIAVHPRHRGRGIARRLMAHLHDVAACRGAEQVRLKVYRDNTPARRLYESLGYVFTPYAENELLGFLSIAQLVST